MKRNLVQTNHNKRQQKEFLKEIKRILKLFKNQEIDQIKLKERILLPTIALNNNNINKRINYLLDKDPIQKQTIELLQREIEILLENL